jgi:hypothetical protein
VGTIGAEGMSQMGKHLFIPKFELQYHPKKMEILNIQTKENKIL